MRCSCPVPGAPDQRCGGSTVTLDGARDNWFGPWPPPGMTDESGEVPVEERRAAG